MEGKSGLTECIFGLVVSISVIRPALIDTDSTLIDNRGPHLVSKVPLNSMILDIFVPQMCLFLCSRMAL